MIFLLALLFLQCDDVQVQSVLPTVAIGPYSPENSFGPSTLFINDLSKRQLRLHPDPNLSVEGSTLRITPPKGAQKEYSVEIRYRTTLRVLSDMRINVLDEWKHFVSPWRVLRKAGDTNDFAIPIFTKKESSMFPPVTKTQVRAAWMAWQSKHYPPGSTWWSGPDTEFYYLVSIDEYHLRISVREKGEWVVLNTIEIIKPENGC
jgi:hypothetical protein